jgi:hypothetical protein
MEEQPPVIGTKIPNAIIDKLFTLEEDPRGRPIYHLKPNEADDLAQKFPGGRVESTERGNELIFQDDERDEDGVILMIDYESMDPAKEANWDEGAAYPLGAEELKKYMVIDNQDDRFSGEDGVRERVLEALIDIAGERDANRDEEMEGGKTRRRKTRKGKTKTKTRKGKGKRKTTRRRKH